MRCTEQEIEIANEYETLKANFFGIEETLRSRKLWLDERNALEHALDLLAEDLAEARAEYFASADRP